MNKLVSVIIPVIENDPFIQETIESIEKSSYQNIEVIIINHKKERSHQRNVGISEARGEYLLILDADQRIHQWLIEECIELMSCGYSCLYIPETITTKGWFAKLRNFERQFYTGTAVDVPRFVKNNCCPLFDETMSGPEDADWGNRIKGFRGITTLPLYHQDNIGLKDYLRKKAYYSKSMKRYVEKWPDDKCLDLWYRCFGVFIEDGKWKELVKHPILTIGLVMLIITRGVIYYANR